MMFQIMNYWEGNTPDDRPCSQETDFTCSDQKKEMNDIIP